MSKEDIHVLPIDDIIPHEEIDTDCICDPTIEVHGASLVIIHNSFDGRENTKENNTKDHD